VLILIKRNVKYDLKYIALFFVVFSVIVANFITYVIMNFFGIPNMKIGCQIATSAFFIASVLVIYPAIRIYLKFLEIKQRSIENLKRDYLTNLYTRKSFEDEFSRFLRDESLKKNELCLMLLDLDDFKETNDTYGHSAGDAVLVEIGKRIQSITRKSDIAARHGGEEFVLVLMDMQKEKVFEKSQEICNMLNDEIIYQKNTVPFSASIGCIHCKTFDFDLDKLLRFADEQLYKAKANGKGRAEILFYNDADLLQAR